MREIGVATAFDGRSRRVALSAGVVSRTISHLRKAVMPRGPVSAPTPVTQGALRESEERFRQIAENIQEVFWMFDPDFSKTIYVSPMYEEICGLSCESLYQDPRSFLSRIHPDDVELVTSVMGRAHEDIPAQVEYRVIRPDASIRWVLSRGFPVYNAHRELYRVVGTTKDITEQKQAEDVVRRTQRQARRMADRMRAIAAAASAVIGTESVDGLRDILRRACETVIPLDVFMFALYDEPSESLHFLGCYDQGIDAPDEVVPIQGTPSESVVRMRSSLLTLRSDDAAALGAKPIGTGRRSESVIRTPILAGERVLGVVAVHSYTPDLYDDQDVEVLEAVAALAATAVLNLQHIAERKRAEEDRSRLAEVLEVTPDFVGIAHANGQILYCNHSARELLGIRGDEVLTNRTIFEAHPQSEHRRLREEIIPTAVRDGTWSGETAFRSGDGREISMSQVLIAHKESVGALKYFSTIARDLTERKLLEEQLRQSQKMEAVGRLAGGVAHDFNNLLTAVQGNVELLLADLPPDEDLRELATEIKTAAERATGLTRQLLAFSRRQVLQPRLVDLKQTVADLQKLLRRLIGEDIELVAVFPMEPTVVHIDPGQLEQVILNLVVNARDAMPMGGRINIELSPVHVAPRSKRDVPAGEYIALSVSDTGHGMDEMTRARVFEPFFTTKEPGKGTGLGLSTVYGIVKQSGGAIEVESEPGSGSTFTVLLPPVASREVPTDTLLQEDGKRRSGSERILLVEDDEAVRQLARRVLEREGYAVVDARTPGEAVRRVQETGAEFDILVTDLVMPQMNGFELASLLRKDLPQVPVLFFSGYTDRDVPALPGRTAYLAKPFSAHDLLRKVRDTLDARGVVPILGTD